MQRSQKTTQKRLIQIKQKDIGIQIVCPNCRSNNYRNTGKSQGRQKHQCNDCGRYFVENPKPGTYLEVSEDVWLASDLGFCLDKQEPRSKLVFLYIQQDWLKDIAKKFVRFMAATRRARTVRGYISTFNNFSQYLSENHLEVDIRQINRSVIIGFIEYMAQKGWGAQHRSKQLETLQLLFEVGMRNGWFHLEPYLIYPKDKIKKIERNPRYIPEEVMQQLNQHLDKLPEPIMRMALVIQECGLRIGELCQLPINCLKRDIHGDFFLQFIRWKMSKEDTIPISLELAKVIQEQQQYIQDNLGEHFEYLFCARKPHGFRKDRKERFIPKPDVMIAVCFINALKGLAEEFNITDSLGKRWNFQTHQFRHTVGTRMVNSGVPMHIIQRYLGHESPAMTQVYAHIHDATLKKEITEFHSKVVNISGQVVQSENLEIDSDQDLQWMKKKILAQALPNGSCARPIVKGACPHANACLTCGDFRTTFEFLDQHQEQLEQTEKLIEKAKTNNWQRQVEMNEQVKTNLENIISTLESDNAKNR